MSNIEINNTEDFCSFYGHKSIESISLTNAFTDYMVELYDKINDSYQTRKVSSYNIESLIKQAKQFFSSMGYNIHNVGLLSDETIQKELINKDIHSVNKLADIYNSLPSMVSPFDIPIEGMNSHSFKGYTIAQLLSVDDPKFHQDILKRINVYFDRIKISNNLNEITLNSYIHELTHTQTMSNKGIIEDMYNSEVLSIFNELLFAYHKDIRLFYIYMNKTINSLFQTFTRFYIDFKNVNYNTNKIYSVSFDTHYDYRYLVSVLKAMNLLTIYINSNQKIRNEIIANINQVFDGDKTLETVLDHFDVSTESSIGNRKTLRLINKFDKIKK